MATLLRVNDTIEDLAIVNGPAPPRVLQQLQTIVGGYIEIFTLGRTADRHDVLVLNEDGKRLRLPINWNATLLARASGLPVDDVIVGDVVRAVIEHVGSDNERWI
jgi:hypothetical protein